MSDASYAEYELKEWAVNACKELCEQSISILRDLSRNQTPNPDDYHELLGKLEDFSMFLNNLSLYSSNKDFEVDDIIELLKKLAEYANAIRAGLITTYETHLEQMGKSIDGTCEEVFELTEDHIAEDGPMAQWRKKLEELLEKQSEAALE